jgi:tetratricopeptide (TPR) repeat protein
VIEELYNRRLSIERPYALRGLSNPPPTYQNRDRQIGARTQEVVKKGLDPQQFHSLINMSNLVSNYLKQGRMKDAETIQVQVLKIFKEAIGEEHPTTLSSMSLLVSIYQNQGRWDDVEVLSVQVLGTLMRLLGAKHLYTLSAMSNLAIACQNRGRMEDAEALGVQVLETLMGSLGEDNPYTLCSMGNLASIYQNQGRFEDAETLQVLRNRRENRDMQSHHQGPFLGPTSPSSHCSEASSRPVSVFSLGSAYRSCLRISSKTKLFCKLKGLLYTVGLCESSIPPHHQRFKWTNVSVNTLSYFIMTFHPLLMTCSVTGKHSTMTTSNTSQAPSKLCGSI